MDEERWNTDLYFDHKRDYEERLAKLMPEEGAALEMLEAFYNALEDVLAKVGAKL